MSISGQSGRRRNGGRGEHDYSMGYYQGSGRAVGSRCGDSDLVYSGRLEEIAAKGGDMATVTLYATLGIALVVCAFGPGVWRAFNKRLDRDLDERFGWRTPESGFRKKSGGKTLKRF